MWAPAYSGVATGDTVLWIPGVFRRVVGGNWQIYSASIIQNLGASAANVTVDLIGKGALPSTSFTDVIPPKAAYGINTRFVGTMDPAKWNTAIALGDNWNGTIKVTSTNSQPLAGVSIYYNPGQVTDMAAYEAIRNSDATTNALSMPAVYRKALTPSGLQWSTTLVQNLDNVAGTINVKFYSAAGAAVGNAAGYNVQIPASSSVGLNLKTPVNLPQEALNDLGTGFSGAMYITSSTGLHIIGNTNIVYSSLSRASGYSGFPVQ